MSDIKSQTVVIDKSEENIFNFISDFTNFSQLFPPQVNDLKITKDTCSFSIDGMPNVSLRITERTPFSCVVMSAEDGKLPFELKCCLEKVSEDKCQAQFHFTAELNMMMKMMVEKPLTNFLNILAEKLREIKS
ncbi:hypothetical protein N8904_00080 [Flavobacteriales bacterium]|jgi:hypothetical protein|nr:hypothetical protein [Flavobacteriales bacterium]